MVAAHRAAGAASSGLVDLFRRIMVGDLAVRGGGGSACCGRVSCAWPVTSTSCAVQWRVSKRDVRDQLVLPPQETKVYWMQVRAEVPGSGLLATCCDPR
jgi:hypothetical protein